MMKIVEPSLIVSNFTQSSAWGFAQKSHFGLNVPASPPDVWQGYASPSRVDALNSGYARGSGLAPDIQGQRPNRGPSPNLFQKPTARHSLASYQTAKPRPA
jgi:hypothetical protein